MEYIVPVSITDAMIVSHSVPETDYPAYSAGTTYALAARVILASTHSIYQSIVAGNIGNSPDISPAQWQRIGPTNRWAAFDAAVGTHTSAAGGTITIILQPGIANSLALLDLDVERVDITSTIGSTVIFSQTYYPVLSDVGINNYYSYFFDSIEQRDNIVVTALPPYGNAVLSITLTKTGGVSVGSIIVGTEYDLGDLQLNASVGIIDYSKKSTDAFGVTTVVERDYAKRLRGTTVINSAAADGTHKRLSKLRAQPMVWVGVDAYESTIIYGWLREWEIALQTHVASYITFTIEGLV